MRPSSGKACSRTSGVPAPLVAAGGTGGGAGSGSAAGAGGSGAGGGGGPGGGAGGVGPGGRLGCAWGAAGLGAGARVGGEGWGLEAEGVEEPDQQAGGEPPDQGPVDPEHRAGQVGGRSEE